MIFLAGVISTQPGRKETKLLPMELWPWTKTARSRNPAGSRRPSKPPGPASRFLSERARRIEHRDEGWVIVDPSAGCLFEIERCMWSSDEPLVFDTPARALAAFLRAREYEEGRKRRDREAMIRLGRPLQEPSQYEEESSLAN